MARRGEPDPAAAAVQLAAIAGGAARSPDRGVPPGPQPPGLRVNLAWAAASPCRRPGGLQPAMPQDVLVLPVIEAAVGEIATLEDAADEDEGGARHLGGADRGGDGG